LWHYTCAHGRLALDQGGALLPPLWQVREVPLGLPLSAYALLGLVWATDAEVPGVLALGLTRLTISCDRTAYRYAVPGEVFTPWGEIRSRLPGDLVDALEGAPGVEPSHWWTAEGPVDGARLDRSYGAHP
jgi:hypothetical protein